MMHNAVPTVTVMRLRLKSHADLLYEFILSKTDFHIMIYLKNLRKNANWKH